MGVPALDLPRVNLLIADDVGFGKTVEAGLILRELLLRRRIDFAIVAAPASMTLQWQDELNAKFGLAFKVIDRDVVQAMRRQHGFGVNVWSTGSAFIVSHSLLIDEDNSSADVSGRSLRCLDGVDVFFSPATLCRALANMLRSDWWQPHDVLQSMDHL